MILLELLPLDSLELDSRLADSLRSYSHGFVSLTRNSGDGIIKDSLDEMLRMRSGSG